VAAGDEADVERALSTVGAPMMPYRTFEPESPRASNVSARPDIITAPGQFPLLSAAFETRPEQQQADAVPSVAHPTARNSSEITAAPERAYPHLGPGPTPASDAEPARSTVRSEMHAAFNPLPLPSGPQPFDSKSGPLTSQSETSMPNFIASADVRHRASQEEYGVGRPNEPVPASAVAPTSLVKVFRLLARGDPVAAKSEMVHGLQKLFSQL